MTISSVAQVSVDPSTSKALCVAPAKAKREEKKRRKGEEEKKKRSEKRRAQHSRLELYSSNTIDEWKYYSYCYT